MAELILTDEERATQTFLEWDDATLGKAVKRVANIHHDAVGKESLGVLGAAVSLIVRAIASNAESMEINLTGATDGERDLGNWRITLRRFEEDGDASMGQAE